MDTRHRTQTHTANKGNNSAQRKFGRPIVCLERTDGQTDRNDLLISTRNQEITKPTSRFVFFTHVHYPKRTKLNGFP
eukprot:2195093-Amphidinium_carterae.1